MDRWVQTHDTELYLRERDGDYNPPNRNSSTKDAPTTEEVVPDASTEAVPDASTTDNEVAE
jgi:hypothetical protein